MQADKSLLEHMIDSTSDFAARAKKTAKKVKRTTKSSAARKAVDKNKRAKKVAKKTTRSPLMRPRGRPGSLSAEAARNTHWPAATARRVTANLFERLQSLIGAH